MHIQSSSIGIKHGFSCINFLQVPWEVLETEAEGRGFQHLPRDLANSNALKNHVRSLLLHKKLKIFAKFRVISCTILFRLSTDVARTLFPRTILVLGQGQYTSRDGSNSVAQVRAYLKLRSRALTARAVN